MIQKRVTVPKDNVRFLYTLKGYHFDNRYVCDNKGAVYLIKDDDDDNWVCVRMSPFMTRDGYVEYVLTTKSKTKKHVQAQRIVAGLYCHKPAGKEYVNHKDGNRSNNYYMNLEWVTQSDNILHSYRVLRKTIWNKQKGRFELV